MNDKKSDELSIEDAIGLINNLNQQITIGGFNAKEISELKNLTKEQYAEVGRQLAGIKKEWWLFPDYIWIIGLIGGFLSILYFQQWIVQIVGLILVLYCTAQLGYRSGVQYGYVRGYESGHEEGVHKALGITPKEAIDMHDRAVEMKMDEMLIKKMDQRKEEAK